MTTPWPNFFNCLKCELVYLTYFPTRAAAKAALFNLYIEAFYNTVRPHSALGWLSPAAFAAARALLNTHEKLRFIPLLRAFSCLLFWEGLISA